MARLRYIAIFGYSHESAVIPKNMNQKTNKYRSKVRDEPRILHTVDIFDESESPCETETGILNYRIGGPTFTEIFNGALVKNNDKLELALQEHLSRISNTLNYQYELASQYIWLIHCPIGVEVSPVIDILTPCFHKSMVSLSTALHLTRHGLWGAARPLIRHAFESLVIAKYCSVNNESEVFDKWVDGVDLGCRRIIIKKLEKPDVAEFKRFWGLLSGFTHSSVFASQPDFNIDPHFKEASVNLVFIEMMMECKYHLLISHIITPNMKYYQEEYKDKERAKKLRHLISKNYSESKKRMGKPGKKLIQDYRSSWLIKV